MRLPEIPENCIDIRSGYTTLRIESGRVLICVDARTYRMRGIQANPAELAKLFPSTFGSAIRRDDVEDPAAHNPVTVLDESGEKVAACPTCSLFPRVYENECHIEVAQHAHFSRNHCGKLQHREMVQILFPDEHIPKHAVYCRFCGKGMRRDQLTKHLRVEHGLGNDKTTKKTEKKICQLAGEKAKQRGRKGPSKPQSREKVAAHPLTTGPSFQAVPVPVLYPLKTDPAPVPDPPRADTAQVPCLSHPSPPDPPSARPVIPTVCVADAELTEHLLEESLRNSWEQEEIRLDILHWENYMQGDQYYAF